MSVPNLRRVTQTYTRTCFPSSLKCVLNMIVSVEYHTGQLACSRAVVYFCNTYCYPAYATCMYDILVHNKHTPG